MAASQRRLLTAETSRLGKVDIVAMLRKGEAWSSLPRETREQLYTLLPPPNDTEPPRNPDANPLNIQRLKPYIEEELRRYQDDLRDGREVKKWRIEAMQAGKDHVDGKFDEWKVVAREEYWGKPEGGRVENGKAEEGTATAEGGVEKEDKDADKVNGSSQVDEKSQGGKDVEDSEGEGSEL